MLDFQLLKSHFSFLSLYSWIQSRFERITLQIFDTFILIIAIGMIVRDEQIINACRWNITVQVKRQKRERNIEGDGRNEKFTEIRIRGWRISVNTHRNVLLFPLSRSTLATITFHVIDYRSIRDYDAYFPSYVSRKFMAARSNAPPWTSTVRVARMTPPIRVNPLVCYPVTAVQSSATTLPKLYETV